MWDLIGLVGRFAIGGGSGPCAVHERLAAWQVNAELELAIVIDLNALVCMLACVIGRPVFGLQLRVLIYALFYDLC